MRSNIFGFIACNIMKKTVNSHPFLVSAIAGNTNNASNLNYVIVGLVVVIVILVVVTLIGNKK